MSESRVYFHALGAAAVGRPFRVAFWPYVNAVDLIFLDIAHLEPMAVSTTPKHLAAAEDSWCGSCANFLLNGGIACKAVGEQEIRSKIRAV